jgi:hypothetical protein
MATATSAPSSVALTLYVLHASMVTTLVSEFAGLRRKEP